jgi:hypothetical protein
LSSHGVPQLPVVTMLYEMLGNRYGNTWKVAGTVVWALRTR